MTEMIDIEIHLQYFMHISTEANVPSQYTSNEYIRGQGHENEDG